jgi:hypothetical protein
MPSIERHRQAGEEKPFTAEHAEIAENHGDLCVPAEVHVGRRAVERSPAQ